MDNILTKYIPKVLVNIVKLNMDITANKERFDTVLKELVVCILPDVFGRGVSYCRPKNYLLLDRVCMCVTVPCRHIRRRSDAPGFIRRLYTGDFIVHSINTHGVPSFVTVPRKYL